MSKFELGVIGTTLYPKVVDKFETAVGGETRTIPTDLIRPTAVVGLHGEYELAGKKDLLELDFFGNVSYMKGSNPSMLSLGVGFDLQRNFANIENRTGHSVGLQLGGIYTHTTIETPTTSGSKKSSTSDIGALAMLHIDGYLTPTLKISAGPGVVLPFSGKFAKQHYGLFQIAATYVFGDK